MIFLWNSANTKNKVIKNLDFKLRFFFNQKNSTQDDIKLDSNNINLEDVKNFILKNKNVNLKNKKILNENVKIFFIIRKNYQC